MRYTYHPNDPERFATNLRLDPTTKNLIWDNSRGQDVMIVQTPYGQSPVDRIENLCRALEESALEGERFTEILTGVWVRFITAAEKARQKGCPLNGEASTYTVFSYYMSGDICVIFEPKGQGMISPSCGVPMEMRVSVQEVTRVEGIFKKRTAPTGFYGITFPHDFRGGYTDGDLYYEINGLQIPITSGMIERRIVYVKTGSAPEVMSRNKGLKLI